ncbi:MAG: hypothetical protein KGM92_12805 [Acidobacteriota bacterium]|nr:hypothetical protein [Acidobacteriota bacterium]
MRTATLRQMEAAIQDLHDRTLANLPEVLTRLIYLSSTRDYNTGEYQHAGLADRYGPDTAQKALAGCHQAAFENLLYTDLADLVRQLAAYIESIGAERDQVLDTWRGLQAYRVLIPNACDDLSAELFTSNIKIALEALRAEPAVAPAH